MPKETEMDMKNSGNDKVRGCSPSIPSWERRRLVSVTTGRAHTINPIRLILQKAPEKQPKSPKHHCSPCFKLDFAGREDAPF